MEYLRKQNLICLTVDEIRNLLTEKMKSDLLSALAQSGRTLSSYSGDREAMEELVDALHKEKFTKKEFIECFYAAILAQFVYASNKTHVCFEIKKGINHKKISINNFQDLIDVTEESTLLDFGIFNTDGLRAFQLKQYKESLDTASLLSFIRKKLKGYGKNLGSYNLLILIQGDEASFDQNGFQTMEIDYKTIHEALKKDGIISEAEIILSVNDRNEKDLLIQIFPSLNQYSYKSILGDEWTKF